MFATIAMGIARDTARVKMGAASAKTAGLGPRIAFADHASL